MWYVRSIWWLSWDALLSFNWNKHTRSRTSTNSIRSTYVPSRNLWSRLVILLGIIVVLTNLYSNFFSWTSSSYVIVLTTHVVDWSPNARSVVLLAMSRASRNWTRLYLGWGLGVGVLGSDLHKYRDYNSYIAYYSGPSPHSSSFRVN
jgi:hypothetical protein